MLFWRVLTCGIESSVVCSESKDVSKEHPPPSSVLKSKPGKKQDFTRIPWVIILHNNGCGNLRSYIILFCTSGCFILKNNTFLERRCYVLYYIKFYFSERYRDLIEAADRIADMKQTAEGIISHIENMSSKCLQLQQKHLLGFKLNPSSSKTERSVRVFSWLLYCMQIVIMFETNMIIIWKEKEGWK